MIDIHAHILPGMDDGAADMYDTLEMAMIAVEGGTKEIVATCHCNIPGLFGNYYGEQYIELFRETETALRREGIPLVLYAGMEVFMTHNVPRLLNEGKLLTINGSHYMLVEFNFNEDPEYANRMLDRVSELGIKPVIAHAERYHFVQDDLQLAYEWVKRGYLIQSNKGSFVGRFGRKAEWTAHGLLSHNLVSVIASDAHSPFQRTPYMLDTYGSLLREYPEEYLKVLFEENPKRICKDQQIIRFEERPFWEDI